MSPTLEFEHQVSPQQPPRRRWGWLVGGVFCAVTVGVLIYLSISKSPAPAIVASSDVRESTSAATVNSMSPTRPTAFLGLGDSASTWTLQSLVSSNPEEQKRYERHLRIVGIEKEMLKELSSAQGLETIPAAKAAILRSNLTLIERELQPDGVFADEVVLEATNRIAMLRKDIDDAAKQDVLDASAIRELLVVVRLVKEESETRYLSKIADIAIDSSLPVGERIVSIWSYSELRDPQLDEVITFYLQEIAAGNTGAVVASNEEKQEASRLINELRGGSQ